MSPDSQPKPLTLGSFRRTGSGPHSDENGNLWRYVAYSERADTRTKLPVFSGGLGSDLVLEGWAKPHSGGENAEYMSRLTLASEIAEYRPDGMYAPPCGKPKVYGDDNGNGVADYEDRVAPRQRAEREPARRCAHGRLLPTPPVVLKRRRTCSWLSWRCLRSRCSPSWGALSRAGST